MDDQQLLNTKISQDESEEILLLPKRVMIVSVKIERREKSSGTPIAVFECKHPDKETTIKISSVSFLDGKVIGNSGTWINLNKDNQFKPNSPLAKLLKKIGVDSLSQCEGKQIDTELEGKYLTFKAY